MAETKAPAPQTNVRAPLEARDTLLRIGAALRADPAFLSKLQAFMDEQEGGLSGPTLAQRVDDLAARVAALEGKS